MREPILIRINLSSPAPAYEQIAAEIRSLLVTHKLAPGSALPTVRQLGNDLNVHHNTVAQAYRILAEEGWLDLRRGRGVRVIARTTPARPDPDRHETFGVELKRLLAKAVAEGISPKLIAHQLTTHARALKKWRSPEGGLEP
jgi:DNA-binding transcriptional regulator YhcF (GntR family)